MTVLRFALAATLIATPALSHAQNANPLTANAKVQFGALIVPPSSEPRNPQ